MLSQFDGMICWRPRKQSITRNLLTSAIAIAFTTAWFAVTVSAQSLPAVANADATRYLNDVKALSAPAMEGRGDGSKGLTRAEHLIVARYKSLGLELAGSNGYLQSFQVVTGRRIESGTKLSSVAAGAKPRAYTLRQEYVPLSFTSSGVIDAPVVFAGYGITAPEFSYDDFHDTDVKGKIVLALRGEPEALAQKAEHGGHTTHASLITKAINAKNHGAVALIVVNGKLSVAESDELLHFGDAEGPEEAGIVCLQVKTAVADDWLKSKGSSVSQLQD